MTLAPGSPSAPTLPRFSPVAAPTVRLAPVRPRPLDPRPAGPRPVDPRPVDPRPVDAGQVDGAPAGPARPGVGPAETDTRDREPVSLPTRLRTIAASPVTALVVMLVGLALLVVLPLVGLPFVALVVLPAVVFHLAAERRGRWRRARPLTRSLARH